MSAGTQKVLRSEGPRRDSASSLGSLEALILVCLQPSVLGALPRTESFCVVLIQHLLLSPSPGALLGKYIPELKLQT